MWALISSWFQDEKDLRIRELSSELHREKKKSAAYQEQLQIVLKYIEAHTQRLSLKIDSVSHNLRELESEDPGSSFSDWGNIPSRHKLTVRSTHAQIYFSLSPRRNLIFVTCFSFSSSYICLNATVYKGITECSAC